MKRKTFLATFLILLAVLTSCSNDNWDFEDYEYQSVYFAYQYPVRTIVLGESQFDTELDNMHQFEIMATTGGVYNNESSVTIDYDVDGSLVDGLVFNTTAGDQIQPMPENYYSMMSEQMVIPEGSLAGGVKVQLTDAFFDDPGALKNTYVVPLKITSIANADTILSGVPKTGIANPRRGVASDWDVLPKDFTFYAVKYVNQWDGIYLRRGKDDVTYANGNNESITRHEQYVVDDQVVELNTHSLSELIFPVIVTDSEGQNTTINLMLAVNGSGDITISDNGSGNFSATGSGQFIKDGAKDSWGGKDRNVIYLDYEVDVNNMHVETADTLVLRDRGIGLETFSPVLQ